MTISKQVTTILSGIIESVKEVIPFDISSDTPAIFTQPFTLQSFGVLIGMTGDVRGRLIIDGDEQVFSSIGEGMFGMVIEGEMLESFAGELGNMIAGTLSTSISQKVWKWILLHLLYLLDRQKSMALKKPFD